jgi:uncharacterized protein YhbP (UPF0306 family)
MKLINPGIPSDKLVRPVLSILKRTTLWSMATVSSKNECHINTAYFSYDADLNCYFVSDTATQHTQNLAHSPCAAVTVFDSRQPWDSYHTGLQLFGRSWRASAAESNVARNVHCARFPDYRKYIDSLSVKEVKASPYRFYVFRPDQIKILDERAFGEEVFISADVVNP